MNALTVRIPILSPAFGSADFNDLQPPSQPILQFKELEVDHARYDAWRAACAFEARRRERVAALHRALKTARNASL